MKRMALSVCFILLFWANFSSAGTVEEKKVDAILDISGVYKQTMSMDEVLKGQIEERERAAKSKIEERIVNILKTEFHSEHLLAKVRNEMLKTFTEDELLTLESFYSNPKIRNLSRMEEDAATPLGGKEFRAFLKASEGKKPDEERMKLYDKFESVTQGAKLSTLIVVSMARSMTYGLTGKEMSKDELVQLIKKIKPVMYKNGSLHFLYVYRNASDAEMDTYLQAYSKSNEIKKFMKIIFTKYQEAFDEWGQNAGDKLKKLNLQH